jgi:hypothetical protein
MKKLLPIFAVLSSLVASIAVAQGPPPPVPALPDTPRITNYSLTGSLCTCAVNFAIYGDGTDYLSWIDVYVNNVLNTNWTLTSPTGPLGSIPRPITDGIVTFNAPQTGAVQIIGARRPRRLSQFPENRGITARDFNVALTDIVAQNRENWDKPTISVLGSVTPGHLAAFNSPTVIQDSGTVGTGLVSIFGTITPGHCASWFTTTSIQDAGNPCGGGGGGLSGPGLSTVNGLATWNNTAGTVLKDGNGQTIAGNYNWSGAQNVTVTDPIGLGPNQRQAFQIYANFDNNLTSNPGFIFNNGLELDDVSLYGDYFLSATTTAKSTFLNMNATGSHQGAGQHNIYGMQMTCYGMGDCAIGQQFVTFANFPTNGDEGTGWGLASRLSQLGATALATVTSSSKNTCNTTTAQSIGGSATPQTVNVASGVGCTANTWVVANREQATGGRNHEAVQIISSTPTSITGVFRASYNNGVTITPALDLITNGGGPPGQGRLLVNISATPYSTGTIASISGGGVTGSGTAWTANMVGGDSLNPGCMTMAADDYSGSPFNGGGNATLHSYFQIYNFGTATSFGIWSFSAAGSNAYNGKGPGAGAYRILPCSEVLRIVSNSEVILADSNFTWTNGQTIEYAIPPYPDVTGFTWNADTYTNGGTYRALLSLNNHGAREFGAGIAVGCQFGPSCSQVAGADVHVFMQGISVNGAEQGICISCGGGNPALWPSQAAIQFGWPPASGLTAPQYDFAGRIGWGVNISWIQFTGGNNGLEIQMIPASSPVGKLASFTSGCINCSWTGPAVSPLLQWSGMFSPGPIGSGTLTFAQIPTCVAALQGVMVNISDAGTQFWGTVVNAGFGTQKVLVRCDGSNWSVVGGGSTFAYPAAFSTLPACNAAQAGQLANVTDSNSAVWGATAAGGGTNKALLRCNGTNWTVAGI